MIKDIDGLKPGTKIEYGMFTNITFEGTDSKHVIMKDKNGNEKRVFKSLFKKYGNIVNK